MLAQTHLENPPAAAGTARCVACLNLIVDNEDRVSVHGALVHIQCARAGIYEDVPTARHVERLRRSQGFSPQ